MKYKVFLTDSASADILEIWKYIVSNDSMHAADKIKEALKKTIEELTVLPKRGHIPPELESIGVFDYNEVHCKPYRVIYSIRENNVYVIAVFDGRRYLNEILAQRYFRVKNID